MSFGYQFRVWSALFGVPGCRNLIRISLDDKYSGSMKINTHLDHMSRCKSASVTNWSSRWIAMRSGYRSRVWSAVFGIQCLGFGLPPRRHTGLPGSGHHSRVPDSGIRVLGSVCQVSGFGFRVLGFGFQVSSFGFRVSGSGLQVWVSGYGLRISGFGFRVSGFGFRVSSSQLT